MSLLRRLVVFIPAIFQDQVACFMLSFFFSSGLDDTLLLMICFITFLLPCKMSKKCFLIDVTTFFFFFCIALRAVPLFHCFLCLPINVFSF